MCFYNYTNFELYLEIVYFFPLAPNHISKTISFKPLGNPFIILRVDFSDNPLIYLQHLPVQILLNYVLTLAMEKSPKNAVNTNSVNSVVNSRKNHTMPGTGVSAKKNTRRGTLLLISIRRFLIMFLAFLFLILI